MPARPASSSTASRKPRFCVSRTKVITSPEVWHPKQWKTWSSALTLNDGVFSVWNGHSPT
jgi:hypothetical protein